MAGTNLEAEIPAGVDIDPTYEEQILLNSCSKRSVTRLISGPHSAEYVNDFFSTGRIRLSTFRAFHELESDLRRDKDEGHIVIAAQIPDETLITIGSTGFYHYALCSYGQELRADQMDIFEGSTGFVIEDPTAFSNAVANSIGAISHDHGECLYRRFKILISRPAGLARNRIDHKLLQLVNKAQYFIKPMRYAPEKEYRFIWEMEDDLDGPKCFECPEAVTYCRRLK
jgi:hypothetical protein